MNTTSLNNLLEIKVKNTKTGEFYQLTGFLSRSDGVVTQLGLKKSNGSFYTRTIISLDFSDFELVDYGWQPFKTAPKTGQSVITNYGSAVYLDRDNNRCKEEGWYYIADLNDYECDARPLTILPQWWIKLPPVPTKAH